MLLVSGNANPQLSKKIAVCLGTPLVDPQIIRFANGEIYCELEQNVRGAHVFVIQTLSHPVNDNLMELLIIMDALKRASAASIIAVLPHYAYARQDRKSSPRTPISAKLVADLLTVAGASRVITMDLHTDQIQGFFNIPFDNLYASPILIDYIKKHLLKEKTILVAPDMGSAERVRHYAEKCGTDMALIDKRRKGKNLAQAMNVVGDVQGKECVVIDDIIDTAGTLLEACKSLRKNGATKVYAAATHGILSSPAFERISTSKNLDQVITTDTIPLSSQWHSLEKIKILSVSELLSKAIDFTFNHHSISSLFR